MPFTPPPLTVFLHHGFEDARAIAALQARLAADGVQVLLAEESGRKVPRESAVREAVEKSDVVLACLSQAGIDALGGEIGLVADGVRERRLGDLSLIPVRFEPSELPDVLKRWQAIDLFREDGYEKLMLALRLRAEKAGSALEERDGWRAPFRLEAEAEAAPVETEKPAPIPFLAIVAAILIVAILALWVFPGFLRAVSNTPVPVNVMVENSTQSALERARNRSMTQTALAEAVRVPLTQTAAAIETLAHPPTATLQFPTIIARPTEILAPGNVTMVFVPGDNFTLGSDTEGTDAKPVQTLYVNPFYIDKFEVTNALYRVCVDAGGCKPPGNTASETRSRYYESLEFANYPMVNVTWQMAKQYCEWRNTRLPTEAEWEKAARGIDGREYPWGGGEPACTLANYTGADGPCAGDTTAVDGQKDGQSLYGVYNMAGNAAEWANSLYWRYPYLATDGREDLNTAGLRVVRGGNWASLVSEIAAYARLGLDPVTASPTLGFRCAQDIQP